MARIGKAARQRIKAREERKKRREEWGKRLQNVTFFTEEVRTFQVQKICPPFANEAFALNDLEAEIGREAMKHCEVERVESGYGTVYKATFKMVICGKEHKWQR